METNIYKKKWSKINKWSKKIKAINLLGGSCNCGENNPLKLSFHHKYDKKYLINKILNRRWSFIKEELSKCKLMCHNCHMEHHHLEKNTRHQNNKKIYLEFIGEKNCSKCGYNKCNSALHFHHKENKSFQISSLNKAMKSIDVLSNIITEELSKCEILCSNCHSIQHADMEFYNENRIEIHNKSENIREINRYDIKQIKNLKAKGFSNIEISKKIGCRRETIWNMLKK